MSRLKHLPQREPTFHCCGREGSIWFEIEEFDRWDLRLDRLAEAVAEAAGCVGRLVELVPDRLWLLGTVPTDGKTRQVFGRPVRLKASAQPPVLTLASVPSDAFTGQSNLRLCRPSGRARGACRRLLGGTR